jgi:hypothetical protein
LIEIMPVGHFCSSITRTYQDRNVLQKCAASHLTIG